MPFKFSITSAVLMIVFLAGVSMIAQMGLTLHANSLRNDLDTVAEHSDTITGNISRIQVDLLLARRAEKDYLLRKEERYAKRHEEIMTGLHDRVALLAQQAEGIPELVALHALAESFDTSLSAYEASFAELVVANQLLGEDETRGLQMQLRSAVHEIESYLTETGNHAMEAKMLMMRRHEKDFIMRRDPKYLERLNDRVAEFLNFPASFYDSPANQSRTETLLNSYQQSFQAFVKQTEAEAAIRRQLSARYGEMEPRFAALTETVANYEARTTAGTKNAQRSTEIRGFAVGALGLVSFVLIATWIAFGITRPLQRVSKALRRLTRGELSEETNLTPAQFGVLSGRLREIHELIQSLNTFRDWLIRERQTQAERQQQEAEQTEMVEVLKSHLAGLSQGDLTSRIDSRFPADYEPLRHDFNRTLKRLNGIVSDVVDTSGSIRTGAAEIRGSSDDLSQRTESQAATLEQTAAALDEMASSVKSTSQGADAVENTVQSAKAVADASGETVQTAVQAMTGIEESATRVAQIISVIDDIAFQTNLLALNAGVEAARAGEAGKGFAVVASEVRALAQRSSEAAMEINRLISDSSRQVSEGVALVGDAGAALERITSQVDHISGLVTGIARSAAEQSAGLDEINIGMAQLGQVTQHNAAMAEESTATVHLLDGDASRLAQLVSVFRTAPRGGATTNGADAGGRTPVAFIDSDGMTAGAA